MTIEQAVDAVILELVTKKQTFSSHDITVILRAKVNNGTVVIDAAQDTVTDSNGKVLPRIEHDVVKKDVASLFATGKYVGYSRVHNGTYYQYGPAVDFTDVPTVDTTKDDPTDPGTAYDGSPIL